MRILVAVVAMLAAFTVPAAVGAPRDPADRPDPAIADGSAQRALDQGRARWREQGVRSYRMRVRLSCFCPREIRAPRTLTVRDGRPVRPVPQHLRRFATVSRLFATIQRAIDARAVALTAEYGADGVPRTIYVDRSRMIADEELGVGVDRFRRIGG